MKFWVDAQLPTGLALWMRQEFGVNALPLKALGLRDASDDEIFEAAREAGAVIISKDSDFVDLISRLGPPPQLLWVVCGNVTNRHLQAVFAATFQDAFRLLHEGEGIVEIGDFQNRES